MGTLKSRMQADLHEAMKEGQDTAKSVLRMALAAVTNAEVAGDEAVELTDDQIVGVLRGEAKKRTEAAEIYESAGRAESAAKERAEAEVLARYLPAAVGADQLQAIVDEEVTAAASRGVTGMKAMGQVVKAVRGRVGPAADGAVIADMVKAALA